MQLVLAHTTFASISWVEALLASVGSPALLAALVAFCATAGVVWLVGRVLRREPSPLEQRVAKIAVESVDTTIAGQGVFGGWTEALASQIPETDRERRDFRRLLRSAGMYDHSAARSIYAMRFVLLALPLAVAGLLAVAAPPAHTWTILIVGALVAGVLSIVPRMYVFARRRRRLAAIRQGLPDCLDMLSMCVGGGLNVPESLAHVARQLTTCPPLADELSILRRQASVSSLDQALADFTSRVDIPEARQLAGLLTRSERMGTRLAGSLLGQADSLRTARRQAAQLRANKAPVKLVLPLMFCFAPAAIILLCAPAMIELKEFLAPSANSSAISSAASDEIGRTAILSALDELDQDYSNQ